jgi:hypothetical protein
MSVGNLIRYGQPFSNVVNNGVATNNVTPGRTVETIRLKLGGVGLTKAMLDSIKLKANGKVIIDLSGTQLDKINQYRGLPADAAFLDIDFADDAMLSQFDRMVTAFDTSVGIANLTTEVKIVGANAPELTPIILESGQQKDRNGNYAPYAGLMAKVLSYPFNMANGGRLPFTVPFGPQHGAIIKRVHVFHSGNMTGATVKQDGLVIHESLAAENEFYLEKHGKVPQANVYTIDFCPDGNIADALNTKDARALEWLLDFSAADNGDVIVEYVDTLGNL